MKRSLFSSLLISLPFIFLFGQDSIRISGKIINRLDDHIKLVYTQNFLDRTVAEYPAVLDEEGKFILTLPLAESKNLRLWHGDQKAMLFLSPGEELHIELDALEFDKSIRFSGNGASANNFLADHYLRFQDSTAMAEFFSYFSQDDPDSFSIYVSRVYHEKVNHMQGYMKEEKLPQQLVDEKMEEFRSKKGSDLIYYQGFYQIKSQTLDLEPLPITFLNWLNFIPKDEARHLDVPSFRAVLKDMIRLELRKEGKENPGIKEEIEHLKVLYSGKVEEVLWASYLADAIDADRFSEIAESWEEFKLKYGESNSWESIQAYKEKKAKLKKGVRAPNFHLQNSKGKWLSLDDFKGKVLYIDFWASWCKPCLEEAESSQLLQEHFAEVKNFEILFVSLDESEERWQQSRNKMSPDGIHLFAGGWESSIRSAYQIRGIPRYVLISKTGELIFANAPRPGNFHLVVKQIEAALE
ncbi:MAG: TlpA disulfide reductase family protein [Bacteroidota bacterium]